MGIRGILAGGEHSTESEPRIRFQLVIALDGSEMKAMCWSLEYTCRGKSNHHSVLVISEDCAIQNQATNHGPRHDRGPSWGLTTTRYSSKQPAITYIVLCNEWFLDYGFSGGSRSCASACGGISTIASWHQM